MTPPPASAPRPTAAGAASTSASHGDALRPIEEISAEASHALGEVREISYNLRPYQLDRIGLTKALEALARTAAASSSITFRADIDDVDHFFAAESEINFYRIVRSVTNRLPIPPPTRAARLNRDLRAGTTARRHRGDPVRARRGYHDHYRNRLAGASQWPVKYAS